MCLEANSKQKKTCLICGLQDNVWKMFQIARLEHLFKITADIHTAEKMLEEIQKRRAVVSG